jgi:hypothetical protein
MVWSILYPLPEALIVAPGNVEKQKVSCARVLLCRG